MIKSQKLVAESALIFISILSGLFPVLTVIAYTNYLSPLTTLAWSYLVATIFFAIVLTIRKEWKKNIFNTKALKDIALTVFFIAIIFHFLYFLSLQYTSAQNVSLLSLMEVFFGFVIIGFITKKEPISKQHISGAMLMLLSAGIILFSNTTALNIGDFIILTAVIIAPIGNIFAKRALHQVSLAYLLFIRSLVGLVVFFSCSFIFENSMSPNELIQSIPYLLFSGLIFLGFLKIVIMFGFKKTSVTHTISFSSLKPVFAFIFAWLLLKEAPTMVQMIALIPSFLGLYLLARAKQKQTQYGHENNV